MDIHRLKAAFTEDYLIINVTRLTKYIYHYSMVYAIFAYHRLGSTRSAEYKDQAFQHEQNFIRRPS